jgi:hypothetical protein
VSLGLYPRYLDAFVRFDMRPEMNVVSFRNVAHSLSVASNTMEVKE